MEKKKTVVFPVKLVRELWRLVEEKRDVSNYPEIIYHFTDIDGMIGIYKERCLWASHANALNDVTEILYGIDVAKNHISAKLIPSSDTSSKPHIPMPMKHNDILKAVFKYLREPYENDTRYEAFVISFCGSITGSMHWLHYGHKGQGVAMGFDPSSFKSRFLLFPVEYDKSKFESLVDNIIEKTHEVLDEYDALNHQDTIDLAGIVVSSFLRMQATRFKDKCFHGEEEWRLISWLPMSADTSYRVNFRVLNNRVIPYLKLALDLHGSQLKEIVLGNSSSMQEDDAGLRMLVGERIKISKSKVPVR